MGSARVLTSRLVWATTLVFAAAAFVLGYIGFSGYDVMVAALRARHRVAVGISRRPLDVVSLDAIATRVLLDTYGPGYAGPCPTPAVVAGTGSFPLALLREMSRAQQHARIRRQVVVVTHRPEVVRAAEALTDLTGVELSVVETIPDLPDAVLQVCYADPDRVLREGLAHRPSGPDSVVLCLGRLAGPGDALNDEKVFDTAGVRVFGILDAACEPERLETDLADRLARAVHANYVAVQTAAGAAPEGSVVPWELLDESLRIDNRGAAADIENTLMALDAVLMELGRVYPTFRRPRRATCSHGSGPATTG